MALTVTEDGLMTANSMRSESRGSEGFNRYIDVATVRRSHRPAEGPVAPSFLVNESMPLGPMPRVTLSIADSDRKSSNLEGHTKPLANETRIAMLAQGILAVDTGDDPDRIQIEQDASTKDIVLTVNGQKSRHSNVTTVSLYTHGGNDVVKTPGRTWVSDVLSQCGLPVEAYVFVNAGEGNDIVDLSAITHYDTTIVGDDGTDFLVGGYSGSSPTGFRTDHIFGDSFVSRDPGSDVIVARPDSLNQLTVTDARADPRDTVVWLPPADRGCGSGPEKTETNPDV